MNTLKKKLDFTSFCQKLCWKLSNQNQFGSWSNNILRNSPISPKEIVCSSLWTCSKQSTDMTKNASGLFHIHKVHIFREGHNIWKRNQIMFLCRCGSQMYLTKLIHIQPNFETSNPESSWVFNQLEQVYKFCKSFSLFVIVFFVKEDNIVCKTCENSEFVVSELVICSGEQDINLVGSIC